jgi:hypothetical protein
MQRIKLYTYKENALEHLPTAFVAYCLQNEHSLSKQSFEMWQGFHQELRYPPMLASSRVSAQWAAPKKKEVLLDGILNLTPCSEGFPSVMTITSSTLMFQCSYSLNIRLTTSARSISSFMLGWVYSMIMSKMAIGMETSSGTLSPS